ncbi:hypothetical protein Cgig2_003043 [Carnegiea gigantea]|uniref:RNase H type-1 domain-containing protein n=1 Tax=Carnegiea gigantea TaxID=171969 RepID=A0A9Q1JT33_9CARY|nr:hypothetical protein Cgig2_003043 [Carnegiea gigantea]
MWAQRAKANFLMHGDLNSRWFHTRANMRRVTNLISGLRREDGSVAKNEDDIEAEIVDFFSKLFSSTGSLNLDETAAAHGFKRLVVKGDSLALISKLKKGDKPNNLVVFDFVSSNFVKRGYNSIAHAIAHLRPINFCERTWKDRMPDIVYDLAAKDMCTYLDNQSI